MAFYESLYVLKPSLTDEEIEKSIQKMRGTLERAGATVTRAELWGKKKLAYEVQHERRGTYILLQYEGGGAAVSELERTFRIDDTVMKYLTVKAERTSQTTAAATGARPRAEERVEPKASNIKETAAENPAVEEENHGQLQ